MYQIIFVIPCGDHVHHHRVETDDPETAAILGELANEINNHDPDCWVACPHPVRPYQIAS